MRTYLGCRWESIKQIRHNLVANSGALPRHGCGCLRARLSATLERARSIPQSSLASKSLARRMGSLLVAERDEMKKKQRAHRQEKTKGATQLKEVDIDVRGKNKA